MLLLLKMLVMSFNFLWKWKISYFVCSSSAFLLYCFTSHFCCSYLVSFGVYGYISICFMNLVSSKNFRYHPLFSRSFTFFLYPNIFPRALWILFLMFHHWSSIFLLSLLLNLLYLSSSFFVISRFLREEILYTLFFFLLMFSFEFEYFYQRVMIRSYVCTRICGHSFDAILYLLFINK